MSWWTNSTSNSDGFTLCYIKTDGSISLGRVGINETLSAAGVIKLNQWQHIAVVRNSSTVTLYVNGVSVATPTTANLETAITKPLTIGGLFQSSGISNFNGFISNFRVIKGVAVYTGAFTPPIAPLTTAGSTSAASYPSTTNVNTSFAASETSLLTNFSNAGIYDAAVQNNLITVGSSQVSIAQSQWSPTSMAFDGNGDYLEVSGSNQVFNLSSGNWTIEAWIYRNSTNRIDVILNLFNTINTTSGLTFFVNASNQLVIDDGVTGAIAAGTVPSNQWVYLAIVRSSGTTTGYINGTSVGTTAQAPNAAQYARIGFFGNSAAPSTWAFNGYIQDLRITKGVARTIATPTAAFPTR
jgi:hypothetical protein